MNKPLVSIIIPTHNRFDSLLLSLESISKQTFKDFEVIIINDGSEDERYRNHQFDSNVFVIHLENNSVKENGYFSDSIRNHGIDRASGKYIAFLDDDDYWFPSKLEKQINKLQINIFNPLSETKRYLQEKILLQIARKNTRKSWTSSKTIWLDSKTKLKLKTQSSSLISFCPI